jgi:hypothetical protein
VLKFLLAALRPFRIPERQAPELSQGGREAAGGGPATVKLATAKVARARGRRGKKQAADRFTLSRSTSDENRDYRLRSGLTRKWTRVRRTSLHRAIWTSFVTVPDSSSGEDGCLRMAAK